MDKLVNKLDAVTNRRRRVYEIGRRDVWSRWRVVMVARGGRKNAMAWYPKRRNDSAGVPPARIWGKGSSMLFGITSIR
jgi:hypothetical protein